ncbi:MAG: hypothetical protein ACKPCM_11590, partial [Pseudanabaena sp.]
LSEDEGDVWLGEEEHTRFESLDSEDEEEIGTPLSEIKIPCAETEEELIEKMYVPSHGVQDTSPLS